MLLRELMDERGLSTDDVASLLAEHGVTIRRGQNAGAPISASAVGRRASSEVPGPWREALGLEPAAPSSSSSTGDDEQEPRKGRRGERSSPRRPAEAAVELVNEPGAAKRIAGAYRFLGAALAAGSGSQGVAYVWDDNADRIAELWLQAAAENPWAARFVALMQAGGPMGDLAAGHLYLAGATLYVIGAGIPAGDAIFAKYSRYRPVRVPATENGDGSGAQERPEPETADGAAEGPVGDDRAQA